MPVFDNIPEGMPRPEGAVRVTEQFFGPDGETIDGPVVGGRVELTYYGADGAIVASRHGALG